MPELTTLGDLYHEGKEFEEILRAMKPELLSYELKEALLLFSSDVFGVQQQDQPNYEEEPVDKTKHLGDLEREEEEEEPMEGKDLEDGIESVDSLSSTPTGNEKPDVIDLHKQQRKEPERPLYQVSTIADTFFND
ncbi:hypothetical protein RchiOBHm_Chr5g0006931 [Rosa chinensis]|uniref:Uncharacterized protein n=1 Tax=Rosa chinensis TaxID=74649 RepID=A0A2P6Q3Q4_ROSCH|nr:hypothetical protein RchiOBHm_Chr5g0006931 [Rosa chinensis]